MNHRMELLTQLVAMSELYGRTLTEGALRMMADDLSDLDHEAVMAALVKYRRSEAGKFFPSVGQIRQLVCPELSDESESRDVASRIVEAMSKYGWTNPEKSRTHIGELGWMVVQREGGWQSMCEKTNNDDLPILKAQWRELAKTLRSQALRGSLDKPPGLLPEGHKAIEFSRDIIKTIPSRTE